MTMSGQGYCASYRNDIVPFFESHGVPLLRVLTDRGTEFCGKVENHTYQLYLVVENIDHSRTKAIRCRPTAFASTSMKRSKTSFMTSRFAKTRGHPLRPAVWWASNTAATVSTISCTAATGRRVSSRLQYR